MSALSRIAVALGVIAFLAIVASTFLVEPATAVSILRYGIWIVGVLGAAGLITGLLAGAEGRGTAIASLAMLLLLAGFYFYSAQRDTSTAPAETAPATGG